MADIIETVASAGTLSKLITGLKATGLAETLKGTGPFTVFAPTDEAFAKLPPGTLDALLGDIPKLRTTLMGHLIQGKLLAEAVMKIDSIQALNGQHLSIDHKNILTVNDAKVVQADVDCDNGVIHIMDGIIFSQ